MGKWDRRYFPRRKSRNYIYQDPPPSPPELYHTQTYISRGETNGVPPWEIDYCHSMRVSWRKVRASKKSIYSHPSVLNWDDSAGEDALQNAKQRYWAMINGLPCDNPIPDPDTYIDEIDWSPYVDPELMADLDLQAFNPDDALESDKLETINEEDDDKNISIGDNPRERNLLMKSIGNSKDDMQGWGKCDDYVDLTNNPWEQSCNEADPAKDNAWRSGKESWGDMPWEKSCRQADPAKGNSWGSGKESWDDRPWEKNNSWTGRNNSWGWPQGADNTGVRQEGWGQRENNYSNNSWGWIAEGSRNSGNCGYSRGNKCLPSTRGRCWRDSGDNYWGQDNMVQSSVRRASTEYDGNERRYWDSQGFQSGGRSSRGGYRKRESSIQHTSKFKSSRYHGDTCRNNCRF